LQLPKLRARVQASPPPIVLPMNAEEIKVRTAAALMPRKRRRDHLKAHGLKPIAPPTYSTPAAPMSAPEPCVLCGAAVEAGQGVCRYCAMKLDRKTVSKTAYFGRKALGLPSAGQLAAAL